MFSVLYTWVAWNSNTLATWCEELTHWKRPWCWERLKAGGEGDDRGWDGWMASLTQWTWVWVDSGSWWWTGRAGVLWFMGSQGRTRLSDWIELSVSACLGPPSHRALWAWRDAYPFPCWLTPSTNTRQSGPKGLAAWIQPGKSSPAPPVMEMQSPDYNSMSTGSQRRPRQESMHNASRKGVSGRLSGRGGLWADMGRWIRSAPERDIIREKSMVKVMEVGWAGTTQLVAHMCSS